MSSFATLFTLLAAAAPALATISATSPVDSTSCSGGKACPIKWQDDGQSPSAATFGDTHVWLMVGNQLQQTMLQDFGTVDPSKQSSLSPTIDPKSGANSDQYFIRFQSVSGTDSNGQPLQSFTAKFSLSGMSGQFSDSIKAQMAGVTSGAPQAVVTATGGAAATAQATVTVTQGSSSAAASGKDEGSSAAPAARVFGGLAALLVSLVLVA